VKQLLDELVRVKLIRESQETNGLLYSPAEEFEDLLRRRVESIDHVIDLGPSVTQKSAQTCTPKEGTHVTQKSSYTPTRKRKSKAPTPRADFCVTAGDEPEKRAAESA